MVETVLQSEITCPHCSFPRKSLHFKVVKLAPIE